MSVVVESALRLEPSALALRQLGDWLRAATELLDPATGTRLLARAELAVHEACMNVVDHAHLPEGSEIELGLVLETHRLTVRITDHGEEFAISEVKVPGPHTIQERGYGVKIIRSLVNDLTYRRSGSTNELELIIDIGERP